MTTPRKTILTEAEILRAASMYIASDDCNDRELGSDEEYAEADFTAGARFALAAAAEREAKLVEALEAMVIMFDDKSRTRRFDETLSVRDNYRKANLLARAALALVKGGE